MYDAIVVGLGGVGSFALRSLAKQGKGGRFLGLDQFHPGGRHRRGSSHGRTRIYRRAYFEHPSYVPWIEFSLREFRQLEVSQDVSLMNACGCLLVAPASTASGGDRNAQSASSSWPPLLASSHASAVEHNIPVEFLSCSDLQERYPQLLYHPRHSMVGLLEPEAGLLRPERVLEAALADAMSPQASASVTVQGCAQVVSLQSVTDGPSTYASVLVQHENGEHEEIQARTVIVSAGAWAGHLIPAWERALIVTRQFQCWIDVSISSLENPAQYSAEQLPAWYMETPDWPIPIYGLPCDPAADDPTARHWLKVSTHGRSAVVSDPSDHPLQLSEREIAECRTAASHGLHPSAWNASEDDQPTFAETVPCLYTMTPDKNFLIGSPAPGIFAVAGLSGHGFKMTPALGQMMADYALGNDLALWKLDFCAPDRFGLQSEAR